ncbi:MAG: histidinol-phosphatase HisJ family protein [Lachnospiraceae bacterium]|nr:histidinol-phosphatase HisJ family protein [Lachnospiraceae bacterium]
MMLRADFHTHTTYCDGKSTPREMVESAYRRGLTDYGVSGHADFSFCEPGFGMSDAILDQYRRELLLLREEYKGKLNLYIGIELDCLGPVQEAEYTIGSTHCVRKDGEYVPVDDAESDLEGAVKRLWEGDWYAFARDYFELEATITDRMPCDWIGHFDLLTKFNQDCRHFDESCDAYLEPALAAMKKLNADGVPFEINTGAISRGYRTEPYPSKILLRELHDMGGQIIINSDSHSAEHIAFDFEQAQRTAVECGFTHSLILVPGGGFCKVEL